MYCKNNKCLTNAFELIESGTCGTGTGPNDRQNILEHDLCEAAAIELGISDIGASRSTTASTSLPPGCVFKGTSLYVYVLAEFSGTCSSTNKCLCYTPSKLSTEYELVIKGRCAANQQIETVEMCNDAAVALLREDLEASDDGKKITSPDYSGTTHVKMIFFLVTKTTWFN
jgi:hypothetical protein